MTDRYFAVDPRSENTVTPLGEFNEWHDALDHLTREDRYNFTEALWVFSEAELRELRADIDRALGG